MKVLHVTDTDLPARRFNGYDLIRDLARRGIQGKQAVLTKKSDSADVVALFDRGDELLQRLLRDIERRHSINDLLVPWGRILAETSEFRDADIVHYHLIHNHVVSLYDLNWLVSLKPSVWTFHDPWPMTGHCVHPMGCEGWLGGCAPCPFLGRLFPLANDHADRLWRAKRRVFSTLDIDVVVASAWMLDMVKRSPLTSHFEHVHLIPFGVDTRHVLDDEEQRESRRLLGIPPDDFVVLFRAQRWEVKGLDSIIKALGLRPPARPTTLLALDGRGLLRDLPQGYRVAELGWIHDEARYSRVLSAADVLLMPSLAEAFGLMAVEAMAAGRPVVCFEGTALPAITHAPDCGMAVPAGDAVALRAALDHLAADPADAARRGRLGRAVVAAEFEHERYLTAVSDLYQSVLERHRPAQ